MLELAALIVGYLCGSIPFGLVLAKAAGLGDVRKIGSGNIGATNVLRTGNKKIAALTLLCDGMKGAIPVLLLGYFGNGQVAIIAGLAALAGHIFPVWLKFRGGKGVATLFGMLLAIQPIVAVSCVAVFIAVLYLTRYVSLSSILAGVALPICVLWIYNEKEVFYRVFAVAIAGLIVLTHQKNISRIFKGNESRVPILKHRDRRKSRKRN